LQNWERKEKYVKYVKFFLRVLGKQNFAQMPVVKKINIIDQKK
jgi:hypothetical protein